MSPPRQDSIAVRVLLLTGTLVFVLVLLAMSEGVLRLVGIGDEDSSGSSRLKYQQVFLPIMEPGERPDGTPIYHTQDQRLPYQAVLRDKPKNGLRVVVFGGSATAGLGYSPNVTFARHLERMLTLAVPDRMVEVVNLGIVALSSKQVVVLIEDIVAHLSPDLMIVYSGNNEFLEIHAEKFAEKNATLKSRIVDLASQTNLYRALARAAHGGPEVPSLAEQDFSHEDLRVSESEIIKDVTMTPDEIAGIVDGYEANMRRIVDSRREAKTPLLMLSVASNWEWRGRSDLPDHWVKELTEIDGPADADAYRRAITVSDERLADDPEPLIRHELLFKRGTAHSQLGDHAAARRDLRTAMNDDPHLRRALDVANERVMRASQEGEVPYLDMVESLAARDDRGIVGFDQFYDYVHFTPEGAIWAAGSIFSKIEALGWVETHPDFNAADYVSARTAEIAALSEDFLGVHEWLGVGFDIDRIRDRDLWKYDKMIIELDELLKREPENFRALAYLGNVMFFRADGAAESAEAYRAALAIEDNPTVRANLQRLLFERAL